MKNKYFLLSFILFLLIPTYLKANGALDHHFKLNGQIIYNNADKELGLYGAKIRLYFLNKKGDVVIPDKLYLYQDKLVTTVQADGSFSFDFTMFINLYNCYQLALEVSPTCEAGTIHYDKNQYIIKSNLGKISLISDLGNACAVVTSLNPDNYQHFHSYNIEISNRLGNQLRSIMLSREYTTHILTNMGIKEKMPFIDVYIEDLGDKIAGRFHHPTLIKSAYIQIDAQGATNNAYICHEYGHYFHYQLVKSSSSESEWSNTSETYKEGIAEFFGMAVRSYGIAVYKDPNINTKNSDHEYNAFLADPFSKASYSATNKQVGQFAGYLWSIYDGPTHPYISERYRGMDNDDVDGYKYKLDIKIFEIIRQINVGEQVIPDLFHIKLIEDLPPALGVSIGKIRSFMLLNKGNADFPMRRVPIKKVMVGTAIYKKMLLSVTLQHYPGSYRCVNQLVNKNELVFNDFKIYKKVNGQWVYFKTYTNILSDAKGLANFYLEDNFNHKKEDYSITPINKSGESLEAVEFSYVPMSVSITGDKSVYADVAGSWTANLVYNNGGLANYTHRWYTKSAGSNAYILAKETKGGGSKAQVSLLAPEGKSFELKVEVEDAQGIKVSSEAMSVKTVVRSLSATIEGPISRHVSEEGIWSVKIEGGVPPRIK